MCQRGWWRGEPKIRDVVGDGLVLVAVWLWLCGWGDGVEGVKWLVCWGGDLWLCSWADKNYF